MKVNMNLNAITNLKNIDTQNQPSKTEQFKKVLDNHEFRFKNLTKEIVNNKYDKDEIVTIDTEKSIIELSSTKDSNNSEDSRSLKAEIIEFIEISIEALNQNQKFSKEPMKEDKINASVDEIQNILQSLSIIIESLKETCVTKNEKIHINSSNIELMSIEELIGEEELTTDEKDIVKNNLNEIFEMLEKSSIDIENSLQILPMIEKLNTEVLEEKVDLTLLKALSFKTDMANNEVVLKNNNSNSEANNGLKSKIVKFIELYTNAINKNTDKSSKQSVGEDKIIEKADQIQLVLQSLSLMLENQNETSVNNNKSDISSINLEKMLEEQLIDVEDLTPVTKDMLKNNLKKIFELIEQSNTNNESNTNSESSPNMISMLEKLITEIKEDLNLSKKPDFQAVITKSKGLITNDNSNLKFNNSLKSELVSFIEAYTNLLKQNAEKTSMEAPSKDKINVQVAQVQHILQSLSSMVQSDKKDSIAKYQKNDVNSINLENIIGVEKLAPDTKDMLKTNLSKIIQLVEKIEVNDKVINQVNQVLQELTTETREAKGDLRLLKIPGIQNIIVNSETVLKENNNFSGNRSFEEKFLNTLIDTDKDELKISKAVNFMNQFKETKNLSTVKVEAPNLIDTDKDELKISKAVDFMNQFKETKNLSTVKVEAPNLVVAKNNFTVDVIKTMKFMENNNIRNLTVTMSPKELGEITIKLTMESGIMKANISAQNKETFNLLNSNMQDISDKLKNMDIKIQSLDINIYEDSTFFNKEESKRNNQDTQNNDSRTNSVLEEDEEEIGIRNIYNVEQNGVNKFV